MQGNEAEAGWPFWQSLGSHPSLLLLYSIGYKRAERPSQSQGEGSEAPCLGEGVAKSYGRKPVDSGHCEGHLWKMQSATVLLSPIQNKTV